MTTTEVTEIPLPPSPPALPELGLSDIPTQKISTPTTENKLFTCTNCNKMFNNAKGLRHHRRLEDEKEAAPPRIKNKSTMTTSSFGTVPLKTVNQIGGLYFFHDENNNIYMSFKK